MPVQSSRPGEGASVCPALVHGAKYGDARLGIVLEVERDKIIRRGRLAPA